MRGAVWPWLLCGLIGGGILLGLALAQRDERLLVAAYVVLAICTLGPVVALLLKRRAP